MKDPITILDRCAEWRKLTCEPVEYNDRLFALCHELQTYCDTRRLEGATVLATLAQAIQRGETPDVESASAVVGRIANLAEHEGIELGWLNPITAGSARVFGGLRRPTRVALPEERARAQQRSSPIDLDCEQLSDREREIGNAILNVPGQAGKEIARAVGCHPDTVRKYLSRGRRLHELGFHNIGQGYYPPR